MQLTVLQCRLLSYHSYYTLTGKLLFIPKEYFLLSFKHFKSGTLSIYTLYYSYVVKNLYEKKNSNDGSISNRFMQGSVYFFPSPLFSSHAELQNYIHHSTADIAYSTSDLFAATVHYTESTCFKFNSFGSAYARVKPHILHVSGCFTLLQVYSTVLHTILTQLRGNIFNNHESEKMLN